MEEFDINLEKYDNSLNFIFGISGESDSYIENTGAEYGDFDVLNNPYFEYIGYEMYSADGEINIKRQYEFELCKREHLEAYMEPTVISWYHQPLCFRDREQVKIHNNWFMTSYTLPAIAIAYCDENKHPDGWCKTKDETDAWLAKHPQYFIQQETIVQSEIWKDDPIVADHPVYDDVENYFPTLNTMSSTNFGPIKVEASARDDLLIFEEIKYGLSTLSTRDNAFFDDVRDTEFLN